MSDASVMDGGPVMDGGAARAEAEGVEIRVRGTVQGVGFRPTVWRHARTCGLVGEVLNDGEGVLIRAGGPGRAIARFLDLLRDQPPPLARVEAVEAAPLGSPPATEDFRIVESGAGHAHTPVSADAAICPACREETTSPFERRFRYPFTNCTHCGPRFTIVRAVPYDRANTTMAPFELCPDCRREYEDPADRRFHAQPVACHRCGPRARLVRLDGRAVSFDQHSMLDDVDAVAGLLTKGEIVAIKGLGGYHLACDATDGAAVARLRARKRRYGKAFALMARDLDVVRRYCPVLAEEATLLDSPEAPIVLLPAVGPERLPDDVAPGLGTLGFMLPYTPLHLLILRRLDRPVVMTSGNLSDEPQVTGDGEVAERLGGIADYALVHDREIANRLDDSVVRTMAGRPRLLRRARGYAPRPLALPPGLEAAPDLLALGGELKSVFCLVKDGAAVPSQHLGDLEDARTYADYERALGLFREIFDHAPRAVAVDRHPDYLSSKLGREMARESGLPLIEVQHHHAHVASCLAENAVPADAPPVMGVAIDGLGWGDDGAIWGGEFLLADYRGYRRLGTFKPVAMIGGAQAIREPWRSTYAHLMAEMGWARFAMNYEDLELFAYLDAKPRGTLDAMMREGVNCPLASSGGRLFDAVAAALGLSRDRAHHEGQAAAELEAVVDPRALAEEGEDLAYPFAVPNLPDGGLPYIEPLAMWQALLGDLILKTPPGVIAARFHRGLAKGIVAMVRRLADAGEDAPPRFDTVVLSGGCFQNRVLLEETGRRLEDGGFRVLTQAKVPANDGGLSLGQAAIAAAHLIGDNGEG